MCVCDLRIGHEAIDFDEEDADEDEEQEDAEACDPAGYVEVELQLLEGRLKLMKNCRN